MAFASDVGIPFYVRDYKELFKSTVVDFFINGYTQGVTPNPCVVCNRDIRFDRLLSEAMSLGGDYLATGHYARVQQGTDGAYRLLKGIDPAKDQSYMLYTMTQERLMRVLFPVGKHSKPEIRQVAQNLDLPVFNRPDSQDLCFLGAGDYRTFLQRHAPGVIEPGAMLNTQGKTIGKHKGLAFYTIGQRKGLGLSAPQPMYVIAMNNNNNTLTVGTADELGRRGLIAGQTTYVSGQAPLTAIRVAAKIRYKARELAAKLEPLPQARSRLIFDKPLRDITPGQAVVFYRDEQVIGGGIIEESFEV